MKVDGANITSDEFHLSGVTEDELVAACRLPQTTPRQPRGKDLPKGCHMYRATDAAAQAC